MIAKSKRNNFIELICNLTDQSRRQEQMALSRREM